MLAHKSYLSVWLAAAVVLVAADRGATCAEEESQVSQQITKLIKQLGDEQYSVRERAQQELIKVGFAAFDALSEAENDPDVEIASQAKYLVRLIRVDWAQETDSPQIKRILKDYESQNERGRQARIAVLAELPDDAGVPALCRLVRFEQSPLLSKQSALAIFKQDPPTDEALWKQHAALISQTLDRSNRPAARWLQIYLQAHRDPAAALAEWIKLVEAEQQPGEQTPWHNVLMTQLLRQVAQLQGQLNRSDDELATMRKMLPLERGDPNSLTALLEWLTKRKAWTIVDEVAQKFAPRFDNDPWLLYMLAHARSAQGNEQAADEIAAKAAKMNPDSSNIHVALGRNLREYGLLKWSDQEFRRAIELDKPGDLSPQLARFWLSDSLHDRDQDEEAGQAMKELVDWIDHKEGAARAWQQAAPMRPESLRSRMHFFFACHYEHAKNAAKQAEELDKGIEQDPSDADVLIGLYHLPEQTSERHKKTLDLIKQAVEEGINQINDESEDSTPYNQLAWLVANTEGDFREAVRWSQKSIELRPDESLQPPGQPCRLGSYLDTLGHCYFALGDYENAVKYQTQANKLEPHMQAISRKLEVFRQALQKQKAAK